MLEPSGEVWSIICPFKVCQLVSNCRSVIPLFNLVIDWGHPEKSVLKTSIMLIHWQRGTLRIACPWLARVMILEGVLEWRFWRMAISELSADVLEDWTNTGETEQINKYLLLIGARFNVNKMSWYKWQNTLWVILLNIFSVKQIPIFQPFLFLDFVHIKEFGLWYFQINLVLNLIFIILVFVFLAFEFL